MIGGSSLAYAFLLIFQHRLTDCVCVCVCALRAPMLWLRLLLLLLLTGHSNGGPLLPNLEVVDSLMVPKGLAPGKYVLQWRWDCEETDQIWSSCADVTIAA